MPVAVRVLGLPTVGCGVDVRQELLEERQKAVSAVSGQLVLPVLENYILGAYIRFICRLPSIDILLSCCNRH